MRTLYGDDEHWWYLQRVRDSTCRDCRVPRGATWCHNTFVTVGNCQIAFCHVQADCLFARPPGTQSAFSRPQRGISFCSLLSQASKPCDSPWKCSKLEFLRIHGWHRIWFNHWILKLTPIQEHGMILDDRHHSTRIWDVLLCRVRGPEDTSQDVPPQTDEFWFRFKTFQSHEIPLVTNTSGDESWIIASAVQFCNSSWVKCCDTCDISCLKWTDDSLTEGTSSTRSWLLWHEKSQDLNGRCALKSYKSWTRITFADPLIWFTWASAVLNSTWLDYFTWRSDRRK